MVGNVINSMVPDKTLTLLEDPEADLRWDRVNGYFYNVLLSY